MNFIIYCIFILTYLLIASRRLRALPIGRPAGALLGAVLMIAVGALSPQESYAAVNHDTIVLLFGMMLLTVYLERVGFFDWIAQWILGALGTPWQLLWATAAISALLSAFLVNDAVCLFFTPVLLAVCRKSRLPLGPYLIALATSANIGSAATLVGNPQNMIIGSLSGMHFVAFLAYSAPAAVLGLLINIGLLRLYFARRLPATLANETPPVRIDRRRLTVVMGVAAAVIAGFFAGFHLGYTAVTGALVLMIYERRDSREVFSRVDWPLLVFFCGLFIVVAGLAKTGLMERIWLPAAPHLTLDRAGGLARFSLLMTLGSNLVSNVPMVLLTGPYLGNLGAASLGWVLLAFTTTIAGNLTLIGSVANIIVAEQAKDVYHLGFWEYLRFGAVSTLLVLAAGVPVIYWLLG